MTKQKGIDPTLLNIFIASQVGDEVLCLCPFHADHHASLSFNVVKGLYLCYSCGAKGTAERLVRETGGRIERNGKRIVGAKSGTEYEDWRHLMDGALAFDDPYLRSRGVTNEQIERFGVRSNSAGPVFFLKDQKGGVCGVLQRKNDPYAFPRYKVYGERPPIWPMPEFLGQHSPYVVEGVFGVLAADRGGVKAFATLGAGVKTTLAPWIASKSCIVMFDHDYAGYSGASRILKFSPMSRIVSPGMQADELADFEWKAIADGGIRTTRSLTELARMSQDSSRFWKATAKTKGR